MNPGILRHVVTIQQRAPLSPSANSIGEGDYAWTTFRSTRARIVQAKGNERVASEAEESVADVEITVRYSEGIAAGMRVVHGSVYYDIRNVVNIEERNRELRLHCTRGASLG